MMILWKYLAEGRLLLPNLLTQPTSLYVNCQSTTRLNHVKQVSAFSHQDSQSRLAYCIVLSVAKCWIKYNWNILNSGVQMSETTLEIWSFFPLTCTPGINRKFIFFQFSFYIVEYMLLEQKSKEKYLLAYIALKWQLF